MGPQNLAFVSAIFCFSLTGSKRLVDTLFRTIGRLKLKAFKKSVRILKLMKIYKTCLTRAREDMDSFSRVRYKP